MAPSQRQQMSGSMATALPSQLEGCDPCKVSATASKPSRKPAIKFIHTLGPSNHAGKVDASNLSLIRSHVAADRHARRRRQLKDAPFKQASEGHKGLRPELRNRKIACFSNPGVGTSRNTALFAGQEEELFEAQDRYFSASPTQYLGGGRKEASQGCFVWSLSEIEHYLFDFYYHGVLSRHYKGCVPHHMNDRFLHRMRLEYVPWAISEPGLLSAMFYVSSVRYLIDYRNDISERAGTWVIKYRHMCIEKIRNAMVSETVSSDATIALALLLAAEAYKSGEMSEWDAHTEAIRHMVRNRGGSGKLGLSGFLGFLVVSCFICAEIEVGDLSMGLTFGPLIPGDLAALPPL